MRFLILFSSLFILLNSCTDNCNCTLVACPCPEISLTLKANSLANNPNGFDPSELDSFYVSLTDLNYTSIETVKLSFSLNGDGSAEDKTSFISGTMFSNFQGFKNHNLIIKNLKTSNVDSIENIGFDEEVEAILCNRCDPCDDEYVTCTKYSNEKLTRNGVVQNDLQILIVNQ